MKNARLEIALVLAGLTVLSAAATALVYHFGWTLYYGDAEAHLNIARRILDTRTRDYDQLGTVWLPLPHLLMLPLVWNDRLWRSGLAGAIPSSVCFVMAGAFLFAAMRRATESPAAALASLGIFALNPNLLYLQSTPMTELVSLAALMAVLYFSVRFRQTQSLGAVAGAGVAALAASLARYEGWFVIPFAAFYFLWAARRHKIATALLFSGIAALGPLYWLAHNWFIYSNALEFFNGPYSAQTIYRQTLAQNTTPYPGDHDWRKAWLFFRTAARLCAGWGAVAVAAAGMFGAIGKRILWPLLFTALLPLFYLWSMHSGGTPIYVPQLWFSSYYNTRYGLAALPLLAIAGGCVILTAGNRLRPFLAGATVAIAVLPWLIHPRPDDWICWKESQVNSEARRAWTKEAANFLASEYQRGQGIFTSFGDLTGIFREAGIPLRDTLHQGNVLEWLSATRRPDLFLRQRWAVAMAGDEVATAVEQATHMSGPRYHLVKSIQVPHAPAIEIYKRDDT
ncbi:MAG TPA: glycosyltransferase family 39 protein [Bryobacteraceae bacterium]|nr:glycosyltransferase family 39 protein [Bryobacteraceae bacterium]